MKQILLILGWGCWVCQVWGQTFTQTVKGQVVDAESRQPLVGATVLVMGTVPLLGATTSFDGYFRIPNVPVGRHTLTITMVGYESSSLQELVVGSGKEIELHIKLSEIIHSLQTLTVKANNQQGNALNDMATVSVRGFSVEQLKRFSPAINDPARMAMNFAGVAANNDLNNGLVIRGNSPKGVLWRMEGVEIPNPNHFSEEGATGGGISALSVNMLSTSDFFTGAFPAEYGNATSGVFDLKLRKGNQEKREYSIQLGVMGADIAAEGPFSQKGKSSYLANYRYSTLAAFKHLGINIAGTATPEFQDAAFKLYFPIGKQTTLSFWGMGGLSQQIRARADRDEAFHSDRGVMGLNLVHFVSDKSFLDATVSWAASRTTFENSYRQQPRRHKEGYTNTALRVSLQWNYKFNAQHSLRLGSIVSRLGFDLFNQSSDNQRTTTRLNQQGETFLLQGYAQWKYRITPTLTLNSGLHGTTLLLNRRAAIEPRAGLRWAFKPQHSLNAGFGVHSRIEAISTYMAEVRIGDNLTAQVNRNLPLTRSTHVVLGYEFRPKDDWKLQVETYYQRHANVPIGPPNTRNLFLRTESLLNLMNGFITDSLIGEGTGRNYGLDLTIEKSLTEGVYFLATASFYEAKYTPRDGRERNTRFNGNFVSNILLGKEWKVGKQRNHIFSFIGRSVWAGGNRYTPINLAESQRRNTTIRYQERAYEAQFPDYFRVDARMSFTRNRRRVTSTYSLDLQNIFNRLNALNAVYDSSTKNIRFDTQLGRIPVLNWRLEF
ncbi:MAG: TonB-dependent receptor [Runella sp.]